LIGANDSWEQNSNLNALQSVTQLTGAFALNPGSKDAAILVTLTPGGYTVQVSGAGDTTGIALVEIYEAP
jgi:hypothetical protein